MKEIRLKMLDSTKETAAGSAEWVKGKLENSYIMIGNNNETGEIEIKIALEKDRGKKVKLALVAKEERGAVDQDKFMRIISKGSLYVVGVYPEKDGSGEKGICLFEETLSREGRKLAISFIDTCVNEIKNRIDDRDEWLKESFSIELIKEQNLG